MPGKPSKASRTRPRPTPRRAGWRNSRYRLRNWPLRWKQIVVILVPTLGALFLGYLRIGTEVDKADEFSRTVSQVDLSSTVADLVHELQGERDLVVGRVASGKADDRSAVTGQIERADNALTDLRNESTEITNLDAAVRARYDKVLGTLDGLAAVRSLAEQTKYPAEDVLSAYDNIIGSLLQLSGEITHVSNDRTITEQAARFDALSNAKEQMAIQNSIMRAAALADEFGPGQLEGLRSAQAEFNAQLTAFREAADPAALARYSNTVAGSEVDNRLRLIQIALNRGEARSPININVSQLDAYTHATLNKMRSVETASLDDVRATAVSLIDEARSNAFRYAAFILAALIVALLLMLMVARSLLKPLRVLRRDALDVASRRLPATVERILADPNPLEAAKNAVEPVPLFTTEEVGQVARSFDAVQHQAVRMATEQAILRDNINSIFVNLSRRSQTLVERQLALIDLLEQDEADPDQLAHLFMLDHLATRMRRNSESLLVLSGTGLSRQLNRPVPVEEVVGAAISEVEQYKRIVVLSAPNAQVLGKAVSDLVHLIAELLDNATFFSGPDQQVRVRMVATRGRELVIQITDNGVGMTPAEIEIANQRLADPPDLDVAVTRRMGLYVVARLAKKHNISVRLRENEDLEGGLITRITVPAEHITYLAPATTQPSATSGSFDRPSANSGSFDRPSAFTGSMGGRTQEYVPPPLRTLFDDPRPSPGVFTTTSTQDTRRVDLEDTLTQRLPIYEEVLSQWFSPDPEPGPESPVDTNTWASPGDEGWLAARTLLSNGGEHAVSENGLPKRIPKARLMPGSALARDAKPTETTAKVPIPRRSAQVTRGRMASLQNGLQRGRDEVVGEDTDGENHNGDNHNSGEEDQQ